MKRLIFAAVRKVRYVFDFYDYYSLYTKHSMQDTPKVSAHYYAELRRHIHSIEISHTFMDGRHTNALNAAIKLNELIEQGRKYVELAEIIQEGENCLAMFLEKTKVSKEEIEKNKLSVHQNLSTFLEGSYPKEITSIYSNKNTLADGSLFSRIIRSRKSVRKYSNRKVTSNLLLDAVADAMHTPSACNRQPWKVYDIKSNYFKEITLNIQNNSSGWREKAGILLITSDLSMYAGSREKNAPFIDGGLFSMSLILALHARGVDTCPLNLNISTSLLKKLTSSLFIKENHVPIMLIAFGYANGEIKVPRGKKITDVNKIYAKI